MAQCTINIVYEDSGIPRSGSKHFEGIYSFHISGLKRHVSSKRQEPLIHRHYHIPEDLNRGLHCCESVKAYDIVPTKEECGIAL